MVHIVEGECTCVDLPPSAFEKLNNRISATNSKINKISNDINNLDDALCEFSTDVDVRVGDVEDALCELSEESEVL